MTEPNLDTLTHRLDRLERENRRLKVAGVAVLLAFAAVGLMGQSLGKSVEAQQFILVDPTGKFRAELAVVADSPGLNLLDRNGKVRATLRLGDGGKPGLSFYDQNGKVLWKAP